jgi:hypothetical protein
MELRLEDSLAAKFTAVVFFFFGAHQGLGLVAQTVLERSGVSLQLAL